jgi:hypothetical protein
MDPDLGGPKTYGSYGSGSITLHPSFVRFARLAGSLTLKNKLSPEKYALLAPARRPALHFLCKIHIQGHLSSIHIAEQLKAKQCKRSKTAKR